MNIELKMVADHCANVLSKSVDVLNKPVNQATVIGQGAASRDEGIALTAKQFLGTQLSEGQSMEANIQAAFQRASADTLTFMRKLIGLTDKIAAAEEARKFTGLKLEALYTDFSKGITILKKHEGNANRVSVTIGFQDGRGKDRQCLLVISPKGFRGAESARLTLISFEANRQDQYMGSKVFSFEHHPELENKFSKLLDLNRLSITY